jgi:hypothetical protein
VIDVDRVQSMSGNYFGVICEHRRKHAWDKVAKPTENMVAREGVEPPAPAFSGLDSLGLNPFSINNLIRQGGPSFVTIL